jgi:single-stranded DNA-binding protein
MTQIRIPYRNDFHVSGRLTADTIVRTTEAGKKYLFGTVAMNRNYQDPETKEWKQHPIFVSFGLWKPEVIERLAPRMKKGAAVDVAGDFDSHSVTDGDKKITHLDLRAQNIQVLSYEKKAEGSQATSEVPADLPTGEPI